MKPQQAQQAFQQRQQNKGITPRRRVPATSVEGKDPTALTCARCRRKVPDCICVGLPVPVDAPEWFNRLNGREKKNAMKMLRLKPSAANWDHLEVALDPRKIPEMTCGTCEQLTGDCTCRDADGNLLRWGPS